MRKVMIFILFLLALLGLYRMYNLLNVETSKEIKILVVYNPENLTNCRYVLNAYRSVLEEEGVPFELLSYTLLFNFEPDKVFLKKHPAIIFPDCINQKLHEDIKEWIQEYIHLGGAVLLAYDVGIKNHKGAYLKKALFSGILGLNYSTYDRLREKAYTHGYFKILQPNLLSITPGKLDKELKLIKGYAYGDLLYPVSRVDILDSSYQVVAEVLTKDGEIYPGVVIKPYGRGYVLWVNLPIGYLKAYSDDLPLRSVLRMFLLKLLHLPHLVNVPGALGGLIINWHIDANPDWHSIAMMIKEGYVRREIRQSFHITAGDFRDSFGDGLGFDACGRGKIFVQMLLPYGVVGSHGGWAHNWFSYGILENRIDLEKMEEYIHKNNQCLESITGYKIVEYSAPNGVHPQPVKTRILEKFGMNSYYYTGDTGSPPNRTFFDGKKVSDKVIAFPVMSFEDKASLYEIWDAGVSEDEVKSFLLSLIDFVVKEKTVRLFYSHPYDIPHYPNAIKAFIEKAVEFSKANRLRVESMSYFSDFLLRFLKTKYTFKLEGDNTLVVNLKNEEGLRDIAIAVPKEYVPTSKIHLRNFVEGKYRYVVIEDNVKELSISFSNKLP